MRNRQVEEKLFVSVFHAGKMNLSSRQVRESVFVRSECLPREPGITIERDVDCMK